MQTQTDHRAQAAVARTARAAPTALLVADGDLLRRRVAAALVRTGISVVDRPAGSEDSAADGAATVVVALDREGTLSALASREAGARVVAVVADHDAGAARAYLGAGAAGVVLESMLETALAPTLAAVAAGQRVMPAQLGPSRSRPVLSGREKQALALVVMGFSNDEIASRLHLTVSTVKSHLRSSFRKLGVRTRNEAAALILDPEAGLGVGILMISSEDPDA